MGLRERFIQSFSKNPWAWLFFAAFVIAERGSWQRGHDLTRVCSLLDHDVVTYGNPITPRQFIDKICSDREAPDTEPPSY